MKEDIRKIVKTLLEQRVHLQLSSRMKIANILKNWHVDAPKRFETNFMTYLTDVMSDYYEM